MIKFLLLSIIYLVVLSRLKSLQRLRRHGDEFERTVGGFYRALGRVDDTMNLGGIKV